MLYLLIYMAAGVAWATYNTLSSGGVELSQGLSLRWRLFGFGVGVALWPLGVTVTVASLIAEALSGGSVDG